MPTALSCLAHRPSRTAARLAALARERGPFRIPAMKRTWVAFRGCRSCGPTREARLAAANGARRCTGCTARSRGDRSARQHVAPQVETDVQPFEAALGDHQLTTA
jgi:hypothetical protein